MFYYKNKKEIYKSLLDIIMNTKYNEYELNIILKIGCYL